MKLVKLVFLACQLAIGLCAASATGDKTLVLYDDTLTNLDEMMPFMNSLNNLALDVKAVTEQFLLFQNDVTAYDNVILFTAKSKTIDLAPSNLLKFVEYGGNLMVLSNSKYVNPSYRSFLNELGIYPSPKHHMLVDHFNNADETHKVVKLNSENVVTKSMISANVDLENIKYTGSVALLNNNQLLLPILQAPSTSYSKNTYDDELDEVNWAVGSQGYLAVAHQALNNGRVTWIGDETFLTENPELSKDIVNWTFAKKNVLKINYVEHAHASGESYEERPYKINDEISYNISISEIVDGASKGHVTETLQLNVKLLDPYHRLNLPVLQEKSTETVYGITFKLPDHHGVFSFEVNYNKPGYSYLSTKVIKAVRHLANDEFPRSWEITNSWVYLTSSVVVVFGWFLFVWGFIYSSGKTSFEESKKDK